MGPVPTQDLWHCFTHSLLLPCYLVCSLQTRAAGAIASWDARDLLAQHFPTTSPQQAQFQGTFLLVCTFFPLPYFLPLCYQLKLIQVASSLHGQIWRPLWGLSQGWTIGWHCCLGSESKPCLSASSSIQESGGSPAILLSFLKPPESVKVFLTCKEFYHQ